MGVFSRAACNESKAMMMHLNPSARSSQPACQIPGQMMISWRWEQEDDTLDEIDADSDVLDEDDVAFAIPHLQTVLLDDADTISD